MHTTLNKRKKLNLVILSVILSSSAVFASEDLRPIKKDLLNIIKEQSFPMKESEKCINNANTYEIVLNCMEIIELEKEQNNLKEQQIAEANSLKLKKELAKAEILKAKLLKSKYEKELKEKLQLEIESRLKAEIEAKLKSEFEAKLKAEIEANIKKERELEKLEKIKKEAIKTASQLSPAEIAFKKKREKYLKAKRARAKKIKAEIEAKRLKKQKIRLEMKK